MDVTPQVDGLVIIFSHSASHPKRKNYADWPSYCMAFSQAVTVNPFRWRIRDDRPYHVTQNRLTMQQNMKASELVNARTWMSARKPASVSHESTQRWISKSKWRKSSFRQQTWQTIPTSWCYSPVYNTKAVWSVCFSTSQKHIVRTWIYARNTAISQVPLSAITQLYPALLYVVQHLLT